MDSDLFIRFRTSRFNVTEQREEYINPGCFGDDLTEWLAKQLTSAGVREVDWGPEDWGWYVTVGKAPTGYFVAAYGKPMTNEGDSNDGDWQLVISKKRTWWDGLRGRRPQIDKADHFVQNILRILQAQPDISEVRFDDSGLAI